MSLSLSELPGLLSQNVAFVEFEFLNVSMNKRITLHRIVMAEEIPETDFSKLGKIETIKCSEFSQYKKKIIASWYLFRTQHSSSDILKLSAWLDTTS